MNFIKSALSDVKLKYKISRVCNEAISSKGTSNAPCFGECVRLGDTYPDLVLNFIRDNLSYSHPEGAGGTIRLLEFLVSTCNYTLHTALAAHTQLQERLLSLAIRRVTDPAHRAVQRQARLTLLEWSRTFAHDSHLEKLSKLARVYEERTGKNLMRSINIQSKKVAFKEVTAQDIIPISPKERPGTMSSTSKPTSLAFTAEVWPCPVCNYLNAPSAKKCASCDTLHIVTAHHVNPNGENGLTKKKPHKTNIGDTITLAEIEQYCKKEKL